jgi:ribonuclease E
MLECLARDRTKHQVAEVTSLGLVQMTRKRVGAGLLEAFSEPCEHCNGRGVIVHFEPTELTGQHPHRSNGQGRGGVGSDHNGRREPSARPAASSGAAVTVVDSSLDSLSESADSGRSGHSGRRNRRDRDRGGRQGSPSVAHAIAGMASAALGASAPGREVYSVDSDAAIDETVEVDTAAAAARSGTDAGVADVVTAPPGEGAPGTSSEAAVPAGDVPPAPPGRRTRSGSAMVRRVTTSDEPVTVVVTVPPVETEPAPPAEVVAAETPATEFPAEEAPAGAPVDDANAAPVAEAIAEAGEVTEPAESPEATGPVDGTMSAETEAPVEAVAEPVAAEAEAPAEAEPVATDPVPAEAEPVAAEAEAPAEPVPAESVPAEEPASEEGPVEASALVIDPPYEAEPVPAEPVPAEAEAPAEPVPAESVPAEEPASEEGPVEASAPVIDPPYGAEPVAAEDAHEARPVADPADATEAIVPAGAEVPAEASVTAEPAEAAPPQDGNQEEGTGFLFEG